MKKYTTLFPECERVHLKKDVGMLQYSLGKHCNYETELLSYENESFSADDIEKFNIITIRKKHGDIIDFAVYLFKYGRKIDILNLYHITSRRNVFWIIVYKFINPRGHIHLKLDADYRMLDIIDVHPKGLIKKLKLYILRNKVDLYTAESQHIRKILEDRWELDIKLLPNGVYREIPISPAQTSQKENYFLTVGRLGTEQKATGDLLDAYKLIKDKTEWMLYLVGPIENSFHEHIKLFLDENPDLKKRIVIKGNISDSSILTELYIGAKVFVLPSKWESFALVLMEALECGDYLIMSDRVPSADDISNNGKYASVVPFHDIEKLSEEMLASTKLSVSDNGLKEMYDWIQDNFSWKSIVIRLDEYLSELATG